MRKNSRTISGVTPVAVMARPQSCPGNCVFCPTYTDSPKSYTPHSPAVLRAAYCEYDPYRQVNERLRIFTAMGHPVDKVELIIMGGTFPASERDYQLSFVKGCYDALNGIVAESLDEAKLINETTAHRCVGLCIETRPDFCTEEHIKDMLYFGATRVELGVQTLDDDIFRLVKRGHTVDAVITSTRLLKAYGFKVYYHWMPGLPGSDIAKDFEMSARLFTDEDFRPDGLKLYPTLVVSGTELEKWYNEGRYKPYALSEMVDLLMQIKNIVPPYVRIPRLMRDIPPEYIVGGCKDLALRSTVKKHMKELNIRCNCTRCREFGHRAKEGWSIGEPVLKRLDYESSGGHEVFLTFEDEDGTLFGLLRLRIGGLFGGMENYALVRELHVFGPEIPLGKQSKDTAQHQGLGKELLSAAESIAINEYNMEKIAIISGVGVRQYFRSECGYQLEGPYMVKTLLKMSRSSVDCTTVKDIL